MEHLRRIIPREHALRGWLASANGWLGGRRPLDSWQDDPEAVLEAVRRAVG